MGIITNDLKCFPDGKANKFSWIFIRFRFRNEHVEHARPPTTCHNYRNTIPGILKRRLLQKSKGNFPTEFPGEFRRGFFGEFLWAFSLEKTGRENPPKNPRQNSNQNLGVSQPKSTLQGSGLET